jgi:hypothetical protein
MENVKWKGEIPSGLRPPGWKNKDSTTMVAPARDMWDTNILQALHVNIEANPFTGKPFFST